MKKLLLAFPFFLGILLCFFACNISTEKNKTSNIPSAENSVDNQLQKIKHLRKSNPDSALLLNQKLIKNINTYNDSIKVEILLTSASLFRNVNIDSTLFYSNKLLTLQQQRKDSLSIGDAYFRLGFYYRKNNEIAKSLNAYYNSIKTYERIKDTIEAGIKLVNLTNLLNSIGNYNEAEQTGVKALQYLEKSANKKYIAGTYNALAIASKEQKIYNEALHWYNKALNVASDSISKIKILNNIAVVYTYQEEYEKAHTLLEKLEKSPELENNPDSYAKNIDNRAYVASLLKVSNAENDLKKALEIRKSNDDISGQTTSYLHLSQYYLNNNQTTKARKMALKAFELAQQTKSTDDTLEALSLLIESSQNPKTYAVVYKNLTDSIHTSQGRLKNTFAKIKYESEKNQQENLKLTNEAKINELRLENQQSRNLLLIIIIGIILSAGFIYYRFIKIKHQREKVDEAYQTEMRISKKIHDELANDVFNIIAFTENTPVEKTIKSNLLLQLDAIYEKARNIARGNGKIDLDTNFSEKIISLINSYCNEDVNILNRGLATFPSEEIPTYIKRVIYRSLQELLVNMKKHSKASVVVFNFTLEKKNLKISYSDNGQGTDISKNFIINGLANVENRIEGVDGNFIFDTMPGKGFKATITIPI
ncbi:tetratricopeptide repeat-containing sensor histidine kinase [Galbibacter sp. BG1]